MQPRLTGDELLDALEAGTVRAAEPQADGSWRVEPWVKEGILDLFRASPVVPMGVFRDKAAFPTRTFDDSSGVRLVPGGSAVRRGSHLGSGVVCMPPMYVNVGAFVGEGSMIDSHALVGSCAQVGRDVHLSAAAQLGGVLEPAGARPVIVEDGAFVGAGVLRRAVLAAGVSLAATTVLYDLVHETEIRGTRENPLEVPADAVVVSGMRKTSGAFAERYGLSQACALIVKYRTESTDAATALEEALRP
jgi:2,3,4,5-tetrahydropyridine-2-carboxylate N-succinyltransferase